MMNLKQGAGFAVLAAIGVALTVGTVATAVSDPGGPGRHDGELLAAGEPVLHGPESPFVPHGEVALAEPTPSDSEDGEEHADGDSPDSTGENGSEPSEVPSGAETAAPGEEDAPGESTGSASSPTQDGTNRVTAPYTDGYLPPNWVRGVAAACGSPVTDLPDSDPDLTTKITGEFEPGTGTLPVTLTGAAGPDDVLGAPILVWSQDDVIVDMGLGWHEADFTVAEALVGPGEWSGLAIAPKFSTCQEDTDATAGMGLQYDNERAPGTYGVRVVTLHTIQRDGGGRLDRLEVSEPVEITVD